MAHLVLYDGECGLCQRAVQWVLPRDPTGLFHFAALQGAVAAPVLARHGALGRMDTVCVVVDPGQPNEQMLVKARAALFLYGTLKGRRGLVAMVAWLPTWLLDVAYDFVATHRYRWFGRADACLRPTPELRARFLD